MPSISAAPPQPKTAPPARQPENSRPKPDEASAAASGAFCGPSAAWAVSFGSRSRVRFFCCSQWASHCVYGKAGQDSARCHGILPSARQWFFSTWESVLSGGRGADKMACGSTFSPACPAAAASASGARRPAPAQARPGHRLELPSRRDESANLSRLLRRRRTATLCLEYGSRAHPFCGGFSHFADPVHTKLSQRPIDPAAGDSLW